MTPQYNHHLVDVRDFSPLNLCNHLHPIWLKDFEGHVILQVLHEVKHLLLQGKTCHVLRGKRFEALKTISSISKSVAKLERQFSF